MRIADIFHFRGKSLSNTRCLLNGWTIQPSRYGRDNEQSSMGVLQALERSFSLSTTQAILVPHSFKPLTFGNISFVFGQIMHSNRPFRSRRLALLLLIGIPVLTLLSVGHILSLQPDGVKLLKRDGSTITFSLPWK